MSDFHTKIDDIIASLRTLIMEKDRAYFDLEDRHTFTVARLIDATEELNALKQTGAR